MPEKMKTKRKKERTEAPHRAEGAEDDVPLPVADEDVGVQVEPSYLRMVETRTKRRKH